MARIITLKFPGRCASCGSMAQRGERAFWSPGLVVHERCVGRKADDGAAAARGVAEITFDADPASDRRIREEEEHRDSDAADLRAQLGDAEDELRRCEAAHDWDAVSSLRTEIRQLRGQLRRGRQEYLADAATVQAHLDEVLAERAHYARRGDRASVADLDREILQLRGQLSRGAHGGRDQEEESKERGQALLRRHAARSANLRRWKGR